MDKCWLRLVRRQYPGSVGVAVAVNLRPQATEASEIDRIEAVSLPTGLDLTLPSLIKARDFSKAELRAAIGATISLPRSLITLVPRTTYSSASSSSPVGTSRAQRTPRFDALESSEFCDRATVR